MTEDRPGDEPVRGNGDLPAAERATVRPTVGPAPLTAANLVLVAVGGAVGTGLRYGLMMLMPPVHGIPVAVFSANVVGAFLLGLLLERLSRGRGDAGLDRRFRLGLGTGVLGGFTTYSTLAVDNVALVLTQPAVAVTYGVGTVIIGGGASLAGIALGRGGAAR